MKINADAIKELADLLNETGLTEIEVAEGEKFIRVNRGGGIIHASQPSVPNMVSDPTIPQPANKDMPSEPVAENHPGAIASPMVGTVYLTPEPGAASFVSKGDSVAAGDTLLIVEAMKVMNPIKAPKSGIVKQVLVQNEQAIEFGDVLMVIE